MRREAVLVDAAVLASLGARAVVGEDDDDGVVHEAEGLEGGDDPADLRVGVGQEAGEDLLLAGQHAPLVRRVVVPGPHPLGPGRQFGPGRDDAIRHLPVEQTLTPGIPTLIEDAPVRIDPFLGHVVGCMHGAQCEVQEEGLAWGTLLLILHHADGLISQVLGQVISLVGSAGRIDVVVVADEVRRPVVGVTLEEAVVALESQTQWPGVERPGGRAVPARREMPLAHRHGRVPGVTEEAGERRRRLG